MNSRFKSVAKFSLQILLGLYLFYFVGSALFLNTSLFTKLTDMDDEELTHIVPHGAFSFFPGYLTMSHALIYISDQNVSIQIDAYHSNLRFDLLPILKKKFHITHLVIGEVTVDVGFKSLPQKMAHLAKYTELKGVNLALKEELSSEAKREHVKLEFPELEIQKLTWAKFPFGKLEGTMSLKGGFNLQPGVEVEVFPTVLSIHEAKIDNQFEKIESSIQVHFDKFEIPDAPGNAIYPFVNADIQASALAKNLEFLNVTLRSLPHYEIGEGQTNLKAHLKIDHGNLTLGSFLETEPSMIRLNTPSIQGRGKGKVVWRVSEQPSVSTLDLGVSPLTLLQTENKANHGSLRDFHLRLHLYGNSLTDAFHGLAGKLSLRDIHWQMHEKNLSAKVNGNLDLIGLSGVMPPAARQNWSTQKTSILLHLQPMTFQSDLFSTVTVTGDVTGAAQALDFASNRMAFPEIKTNLKVEMKGAEPFQASTRLSEVSYLLSPIERWKGHLELTVNDTGPLVKILKAKDKLSWIVGSFADVSNLVANIDWESGEDFSWARLNDVHSSGLWHGYGSIIQSGDSTTGDFEIKMGGLPIGIRITPKETNVKFLPSEEWYNKILH